MTALKYEKQVSIGGKTYPICYTTAAAIAMQRIKEIRGDLSKMKQSDQTEAMVDIATVMVNGAIAAHNLAEGKQDPLITKEHIIYLASQEETTQLFKTITEISSERKHSVRLEEDPEAKKENAE